MAYATYEQDGRPRIGEVQGQLWCRWMFWWRTGRACGWMPDEVIVEIDGVGATHNLVRAD
jgi:hypothetical protein